MNTSTQRRVSGPTFSGSRLHWEWSLEYRWSFSSERTGPRSRSRREGSSGKRWRWKEYFHFFWSRASWDYFYLAEEAWTKGTLVGRIPGLARFMALGLSDCRHKRVDAASHRIPDRPEWRNSAVELLEIASEPLDPLAVCPHHGRRGANGLLRDGRRRRVLSACKKI